MQTIGAVERRNNRRLEEKLRVVLLVVVGLVIVIFTARAPRYVTLGICNAVSCGSFVCLPVCSFVSHTR